MNRGLIYAFFILLPLGLMATTPHQKNDSGQTPSSRGSSAAHPGPGERVFAANCSRCHQPPMSLPPRMTGTVLMHMRTRARLSREDEKLLLKYLAP